MKFALILLALAALYVNVESQLFHDTSVPDHTAFESFQEYFKRDYHPREKSKRFALFKESRRRVHSMNEKYKHGLLTFKSKLNQFADLTREELKARTVGTVKMPLEELTDTVRVEDLVKHSRKKRQAPAALDWRTPGKVSPVEDQLWCGSGYAFAATGAVDSQNSIVCGIGSIKYSSQSIVDCSGAQGNWNCTSGTTPNAFRYFISLNGPVPLKASYAYTSGDNGDVGPCLYTKAMVSKVKVTAFTNVEPGEPQLLTSVYQIGPVTVYVYVELWSFFFYSSGVWVEPQCTNSTNDMDHYMLCIGYGTTAAGQTFWLIKNSWGTGWGLTGYLKMARNLNNMCCVACRPCYPTIACLP